MHQKVAVELAAALRSGKYAQGNARLRDSKDQYCCLGVLCDLSPVGKWRLIDNFPEYIIPTPDGTKLISVEAACLPHEVMEWAGMRTTWGSYHLPNKTSGDLATDNDRGKSFLELADFIEQNYEHL